MNTPLTITGVYCTFLDIPAHKHRKMLAKNGTLKLSEDSRAEIESGLIGNPINIYGL